MREILFRGKRADNGVWVKGSFIPDLLEVYGRHDLVTWGFIRAHLATNEERMVDVERNTIGQYVGLYDKNGERIFESDIVKQGNRVYVITWRPESASFELCLPGGAEQAGLNIYTTPYLEVIGNIYDNPESLNPELSEIERK